MNGDGLPSQPQRPRIMPVARQLRIFFVVGLAVLAVISVGAAVASREIARRQALGDAEVATSRVAELIIVPLLGDVLAGDGRQREELDLLVDARIAAGPIQRVHVWRGDGTILYSDDDAAIGDRMTPPREVLAAIDRGTTSSDIGTAETTGSTAADERLIEVYVPMAVPGQQPLALEVYYNAERVEAAVAGAGRLLLALTVPPLVLLQLVQLPIVLSLVRRISRQETERTLVLERALSASDRERCKIATELREGVVPDLTAVGHTLAGLAPEVSRSGRPAAAMASASIRAAVESLHRLVVDVYPPDLTGSDLTQAVEDLADRTRAAGIDVTVRVRPLPALDSQTTSVLYRIVREALHAARRSAAASVRIELGPATSASDLDLIRLQVTDDGVRQSADAVGPGQDGQPDLQTLRDQVGGLDGWLTVRPAPRGGTVVDVMMPSRRPAVVMAAMGHQPQPSRTGVQVASSPKG